MPIRIAIASSPFQISKLDEIAVAGQRVDPFRFLLVYLTGPGKLIRRPVVRMRLLPLTPGNGLLMYRSLAVTCQPSQRFKFATTEPSKATRYSPPSVRL